jgi:hypothetical protein
MTSIQKKIIIILTVILAVLLAIASYFGVFVSITYERDAISMAVQGVGQDFVNLFLIVPLLLVILPFIKKDSRIVLLIHTGTVFYVLYSFIIYAFGVHFNILFLLYCFILGLSLYTFIYLIYIMGNMDVPKWFSDKIPFKTIAGFLIIVSLMFYLLWFKEIIPAILNNTLPKSVSDYNLLVNPVHVIDIAFALPGLIISALLLLKRQRFGYIFTAVALEFIILLAIALIGMVVMMKIRSISDDVSIMGIFTVIAILGIICLSLFLKHFKKI